MRVSVLFILNGTNTCCISLTATLTGPISSYVDMEASAAAVPYKGVTADIPDSLAGAMAALSIAKPDPQTERALSLVKDLVPLIDSMVVRAYDSLKDGIAIAGPVVSVPLEEVLALAKVLHVLGVYFQAAK